jgi:hypothetical protein
VLVRHHRGSTGHHGRLLLRLTGCCPCCCFLLLLLQPLVALLTQPTLHYVQQLLAWLQGG